MGIVETSFMEVDMFIFIIVLILLLPVTVLPLALKTSFSANELVEMGVRIDHPDGAVSDAHISQIKNDVPKLCNVCVSA
jgi:hypothetical protein